MANENKATVTVSKLSLRRDNAVPVGQPAPMHCVCTCGNHISIIGETNECTNCGLTVNQGGWILKGRN